MGEGDGLNVAEFVERFDLYDDFSRGDDAAVLRKYGGEKVIAYLVVEGSLRFRKNYYDNGIIRSTPFYVFIFRSQRKYIAYNNGLREHVSRAWVFINEAKMTKEIESGSQERLSRYALLEAV